jgi:tetratricopeptide (TPR) repeat protein
MRRLPVRRFAAGAVAMVALIAYLALSRGGTPHSQSSRASAIGARRGPPRSRDPALPGTPEPSATQPGPGADVVPSTGPSSREDSPARPSDALQRAREDLVAGRLADAMRGFDAAAADPSTAEAARSGRDDTVRAYLVLAAAKEEAGVHAEAAAAYESALLGVDTARVPDGVDLFDVRTRLADALIGAGATQRAVAALDAISAEQRGRPFAKALRAKCALADAGGSEWPAGVVTSLVESGPTAVAMRRLSDRFLAQAKRELRLGLAWVALLDAQVAASLAPTSIEPEYYVGAALVARHAAGTSRPGDEAKARTWLTSFVNRTDALGVGATAEQTSLRNEATKLLDGLPQGK